MATRAVDGSTTAASGADGEQRGVTRGGGQEGDDAAHAVPPTTTGLTRLSWSHIHARSSAKTCMV